MSARLGKVMSCLSACVLVFLVLFCSGLLRLPGDGAIDTFGVVVDPSGKAVPDAVVTLKGPIGTRHEEESATRTDSSGAFQLLLMYDPRAGREFTLRVQSAGFLPDERIIARGAPRQALRVRLFPVGTNAVQD
jgi:hypothetical protein